MASMHNALKYRFMPLQRVDLWARHDCQYQICFLELIELWFFVFEELRNGLLVKFFGYCLGHSCNWLGYFKSGLN